MQWLLWNEEGPNTSKRVKYGDKTYKETVLNRRDEDNLSGNSDLYSDAKYIASNRDTGSESTKGKTQNDDLHYFSVQICRKNAKIATHYCLEVPSV